jgi:hypothetical protein
MQPRGAAWSRAVLPGGERLELSHERRHHMAELTAKKRKSIPKSEYGLPDEKKYPMPDKAHARNAKSRAAQARKAGNLTKDELERIDRKADKILDD